MLVDHSLYNHEDRNAYFTGGICMYDGDSYGWISEVHDDGTTVISLNDGRHVTRDFDTLSFPKPITGLYQNGAWCEMLTLEPIRQWRKVFRTTQYTVTIPTRDLAEERGVSSYRDNELLDNIRLRAIFSKRVYPSAVEARTLLESGDAITIALSRHLWCKKSGNVYKIYTGLSSFTHIGNIRKDGTIRVIKEKFLALLEKVGVVV